MLEIVLWSAGLAVYLAVMGYSLRWADRYARKTARELALVLREAVHGSATDKT